MRAIEFEAVPDQHAIQIPDDVRVVDGKPLRVLLLVRDADATPEQPATAGCGDAFKLLAELSDDFMADGRMQPPLQARGLI